jgi:DNA-directed RNA polymerase subunit M/transcription elongation factor TFIIS
MKKKLITVATYTQPIQAHIAKGRLEAEGILCFLGDENIISVHPFYSNAVGGVKLKVREEEAAQASAILDQIQAEEPEPNTFAAEDHETSEKAILCPNCGSEDAYVNWFSKKIFALSMVLFGFPLPFIRKSFHCPACGHEWKKK